MRQIFNKDGFIWWVGVVEDRQDPEKLGRCKVRIFGYHTDDKKLLPTKDLPWCVPIQPITSAATSGLGSSPLGPIEGTWVIGFFLDGADMQQPAMFGTFSTKATAVSYATAPPKPQLTNLADGTMRDSSGNPVYDKAGIPVKYGAPATSNWELGQTSERYESGGRGPGTINDYNGAASGDYGGASYGAYQFASYLPSKMSSGKSRPSSKNSPVVQFIKNSKFKEEFKGLTPATTGFDNKWKEVAANNTVLFKKDQHDYIKRKYYDVMVASLKRQGLNLSNYGPGVQDLIWSTAVQFGPNRTSIFLTPLKNKTELTDEDIINLVMEYKIANVDIFFKSSSQSVRNGVTARYQSEKAALLQLVKLKPI